MNTSNPSIDTAAVFDVLTPKELETLGNKQDFSSYKPTGVPGYIPMLSAYHRVCSDTLRAIVQSLPLTAGACILDAACGDGAYLQWFAQRIGPRGLVVAVDLKQGCLDMARRTVRRKQEFAPLAFIQSSVEELPFADSAFNLIWCAQSLYSLSHIPLALREMVRTLKPDGTLALLENDSLHHVLFPWPTNLELELQNAERHYFLDHSMNPAKYYIGRNLSRLLRRLGLAQIVEKTWATTRQSPLCSYDRTYFACYLDNLARHVRPYLTPKTLAFFDKLTNPRSKHYLLHRSDLTIAIIDRLAWGTKPAAKESSKKLLSSLPRLHLTS